MRDLKMRIISAIALLGSASTVAGAALHPARQVSRQSSPACAAVATVTQVVTVTEAPRVVTIAVENATSIASSLSFVASIDSEYVSYESELAPISNPIVVTTPTFVHTILVPAFEATEAPHSGSSVYYVSIGPNTTDWSYTPSVSLSVAVGTTTVTVLPTPAASPSDITTTIRGTVVTTATVHTAFTSPTVGWNSTNSNSSIVGGVGTAGTGTRASGGTGAITGTGAGTGLVTTTTSTQYVATVTVNVTVEVTAAATTPPATLSASYSGYGAGYGDIVPRQVCTLISAFIGGHWASWCNNWDGSGTLTFTSWVTTTTPSYIPGLPESTTSSAQSATTLQGPSSAASAPSSTSSSAAATPTACGQVGAFQIGFDDMPAFSTTDNNTTDLPLIFNPFDHFYWGEGWSYAPPPAQPFPPENGSTLAVYVPSLANSHSGSPSAGLLPNSSFGAGPRNYDDHYWFDADSAFVGCDNNATDLAVTCDFVATGYQWDVSSQQEKVVVTQHFNQPPCPNFVDCHLRQIIFSSEFVELTTLSFYANVQGQIKTFWIDSLQLDWYNNTCEAGLARISSRKH